MHIWNNAKDSTLCFFWFLWKKIILQKFEQLNSDSSLSAGVSGTVSSVMNQAGTNAA